MKPNWNDAPGWANYLTKDVDGNWYWWEYYPMFDEIEGLYSFNTIYHGDWEYAGITVQDGYLEERP